MTDLVVAAVGARKFEVIGARGRRAAADSRAVADRVRRACPAELALSAMSRRTPPRSPRALDVLDRLPLASSREASSGCDVNDRMRSCGALGEHQNDEAAGSPSSRHRDRAGASGSRLLLRRWRARKDSRRPTTGAGEIDTIRQRISGRSAVQKRPVNGEGGRRPDGRPALPSLVRARYRPSPALWISCSVPTFPLADSDAALDPCRLVLSLVLADPCLLPLPREPAPAPEAGSAMIWIWRSRLDSGLSERNPLRSSASRSLRLA